MAKQLVKVIYDGSQDYGRKDGKWLIGQTDIKWTVEHHDKARCNPFRVYREADGERKLIDAYADFNSAMICLLAYSKAIKTGEGGICRITA